MPIDLNPPSPERRAELEAQIKKVFQERAEAFTRLRQRSGMSMDELAKAMGYKGSSSIQRYFANDYMKAFRPELARAFRRALLGKGNPPISDDDLVILLSWKELEPSDPGWSESQLVRKWSTNEKIINPQVHADNDLRVTANLPLQEGDVTIDMPRFLSPKSASTLKSWLDHLADLAVSKAEVFDKERERIPINKRKAWGEDK